MHFFRFDHPAYLWLLLLAVPIVLLAWRSLIALEPVRRWTAVGLRLLLLLLIVMILSGLQLVRTHSDLAVVAVLDRSQSIERLSQLPVIDVHSAFTGQTVPGTRVSVTKQVNAWLESAISGRRPDDRLGVISFDGNPTVESLPSTTGQIDSGIAPKPADGTDIASAIRLAMALFPPDSGKRLLLSSDGIDTLAGDEEGRGASSELLRVAREAKAAGIPIDVLPIDYRLSNQAMVESVVTPTQARRGQTLSVRVVLSATRPTSGQLYLKRDGEPVDLTPGKPGDGVPVSASQWTPQQADLAATQPSGDPALKGSASKEGRWISVRLVDVPVTETGVSRFEALFEPSDGAQAMAGNNSAEAFTIVSGKGKVLVVDGVGGPSGGILPKALEQRGIEVVSVAYDGLPADLLGMLRYDAIILQNIPADACTPEQSKFLAKYVNDMGGGFVMIGGPDSFGAGGWTHSPVDRILPVECEIPAQTVLPSGALVIVMDRSGSMGSTVKGSMHTQQEVANEAAVQAISTLYPQDLIGEVVFDNSTQWIVGDVSKLVYNSNPHAIAQQVRSVQPGGGTNIYPGLEQAYLALARLGPDDAAVKHIILLTDGQSQDGPYFDVIGKMRRAGITLSTVGVGDGVNGQLLGNLAQMGGGTYYAVNDPSKLPQIFIKEARTVRRNLIKEKRFVPSIVQTGSPVMQGIDALPALTGLVLTGPKADPRVYTPILGPDGEPLFAHWQVGLGRSAAFTSDATNRWAVNWLGWDGYADFWARTVRLVARPAAGRAYDLSASLQHNRLRLRLDASGIEGSKQRGGDGSFMNFLNVRGGVIGPDGQTLDVKLEQTGPGLYEADVPAAKSGNYVVMLNAQGPRGEGAATIFGGTTRSKSPELRSFVSNRAALEQVAAITGGRVLDPSRPELAHLFTRQSVVESRSLRPLWWPLLGLLVVLFLIDVAVRRIAWDLPAMWAAAVQRFDSVIGVLRSREESQSTQTLAALKKKSAEVERELGGTPARGEQKPATAAPGFPWSQQPASDAKFKFEASQDAQADENFAQAVGAATLDESAGPPARSGGNDPGDSQPATTSRLLDAKKRAQQQIRKKQE